MYRLSEAQWGTIFLVLLFEKYAKFAAREYKRRIIVDVDEGKAISQPPDGKFYSDLREKSSFL